MGKLDVQMLRYLSSEEFRVLTAVSSLNQFINSKNKTTNGTNVTHN